MTALLYCMVLALLIPIAVAGRSNDVWHLLAVLTSLSTKVAVLMLVVSVVRDDWMIGLVGVIIISVGNAGLMLLANLLWGSEP
jgi:multicomponent Na+:H+ antiporter subunit F